jgi:hypothetical protein
MDTFALFTSQLTDIFRIGLLVGLFITIQRTLAQTGYLIPIIAGLIFVAIIIPSTMPNPGIEFWPAAITGFAANAVIFAVIWLVWQAFNRFSPK